MFIYVSKITTELDTTNLDILARNSLMESLLSWREVDRGTNIALYVRSEPFPTCLMTGGQFWGFYTSQQDYDWATHPKPGCSIHNSHDDRLCKVFAHEVILLYVMKGGRLGNNHGLVSQTTAMPDGTVSCGDFYPCQQITTERITQHNTSSCYLKKCKIHNTS